MTERIIPIVLEDSSRSEARSNREPSPESDKEQCKLSKSLEELSVGTVERAADSPEPNKSSDTIIKSQKDFSAKVRVKPAKEIQKGNHEYLKEFDVLEKRDGNAVLSEYSLPNSDINERIILVIDRSQDENYTPFVIGSQKYTPLSMVKRAISIFIKLKLSINSHHEFAIITMNENRASLLLEFTNDNRKLSDCLGKISECDAEDIFDLNSVFNLIVEAPMPELQAPNLPPPFVLRTIIFYGRSYTLPQVCVDDTLNKFLTHPYIFCDILMTHEPVEVSNHCQKIFNILQNLDQKGIAYFFPVGRDVRRMHRCTGKLLAHPLQRPIQKLIKN